jgi:hypothetical protein
LPGRIVWGVVAEGDVWEGDKGVSGWVGEVDEGEGGMWCDAMSGELTETGDESWRGTGGPAWNRGGVMGKLERWGEETGDALGTGGAARARSTWPAEATGATESGSTRRRGGGGTGGVRRDSDVGGVGVGRTSVGTVGGVPKRPAWAEAVAGRVMAAGGAMDAASGSCRSREMHCITYFPFANCDSWDK